ncbi:RNA polymerase sigma factor [Actinoallomurus iriomotensis]|uniref:DNA-directed RNA polymerase sigma-70 factor n=1 Tax=Actinoallomurus iriomotensis TaxID=478107 RepID=A0A9W6RG77_9ACTN|nr:sigma-70 family RNA polymerase sigma factor [Actinoallomurus iriomotensis]GLY73467.1 DNA-directed RNA polymerase sigma-70 factor [Actinoallomurus iriomotensis]
MKDPADRFTALYDRHYRNVLGYALLRAGQDAAEDVASETFLVAWRRLGDLPDPPLPWLLGVARNLLHKQYDSGRRRQALADRIAAATTADDLAGPDVAQGVVDRAAVRAALTALGERDIEVIVLATWYDLAPRDAARVIGCSAAAFAVRLHRARKRLARALRTPPAAPVRTALIQERAR